jgi:hypothetical protein
LEKKAVAKSCDTFFFLGRNAPTPFADGGIYLRKVGPRLFYRDGRLPLAGFGGNLVKQIRIFDTTDYYILIDPVAADAASLSTFRDRAVHVPFNDIFRLEDAVPETLWDVTDRAFLRPKPHSWTRYPMLIALAFQGTLAGKVVHLVVLCDYRKQVPIGKVFRRGQYRRQAAMIFQGRYRNDSTYWADLEMQAPNILLLSNRVEVRLGNQTFRISVSFEKGIVESISREVELFSLNFNVAGSVDNAEGKEQIEDISSDFEAS